MEMDDTTIVNIFSGSVINEAGLVYLDEGIFVSDIAMMSNAADTVFSRLGKIDSTGKNEIETVVGVGFLGGVFASYVAKSFLPNKKNNHDQGVQFAKMEYKRDVGWCVVGIHNLTKIANRNILVVVFNEDAQKIKRITHSLREYGKGVVVAACSLCGNNKLKRQDLKVKKYEVLVRPESYLNSSRPGPVRRG